MKHLILLALAFAPTLAEARGICEPIPDAKTARVKKFTNYAPKWGKINGRCGTSAREYDACKFFLEDHLDGKNNAVMGAATQIGGSSYLFGGLYKAEGLEEAIGVPPAGCVRLALIDRYARSENGKSKIDIVTKYRGLTDKNGNREQGHELIDKVHTAKGTLRPLGRAKIIRDKAARKLARNIDAEGQMPKEFSDAQLSANQEALDKYPASAAEPAVPVTASKNYKDYTPPANVPTPEFRPNSEAALAAEAAAAVVPAVAPAIAERKQKDDVAYPAAQAQVPATPYNGDNKFEGTTSDDLIPSKYSMEDSLTPGISDRTGPAKKTNRFPASKPEGIKIELPEEQK